MTACSPRVGCEYRYCNMIHNRHRTYVNTTVQLGPCSQPHYSIKCQIYKFASLAGIEPMGKRIETRKQKNRNHCAIRAHNRKALESKTCVRTHRKVKYTVPSLFTWATTLLQSFTSLACSVCCPAVFTVSFSCFLMKIGEAFFIAV